MLRRLLVLLVPLLLFACQTPEGSEAGTDPETGEGDGDGDSNTDSQGDGDTSSNTDSGGTTFNCDPSEEMPCPEGLKCTVLTVGGMPVYDCVPDDTGLLPFEPCIPAPSTGQDQCPDNHACIGPTPDAPMGLCLELCTNDNDCDTALCTTPPETLVPVCAAICDPLAPLCPDNQACQRVRLSNFVCQYPLPDDNGTTAESCNIVGDSGCAEGFVCEAGGIIPDCTEQSCCTALCDLTEPNECAAPMLCGELPLDPQPGLENVGACYVPQ